MTLQLDFYQLMAAIQQKFPQFMPFLSQPGVLAVLGDAILNERSDIDTTAALQHTPYFLNTPIAVRQYQAQSFLDPATAKATADVVKNMVDDAEAATGVRLSQDGGFSSQYFQFFVKATQNGWDANRIRYELLALSSGEKGGDLAANAATIKGMANEYGVPLSDMAVQGWAKQLAQGAVTMDSIKGYLVEQAKSLFPSLAGALDRGITVAQYAAPYVQLAVQELGVNPAGISFTDPKWMQALNQVDPKTGQRTAMSLDQWLTTIRTDPRYGYDTTHKANQDASQLATMLEQRFGAAA